MESPTGSTSTGPSPATGNAPASQVDIDGILAEVEALAAKATATAVQADAAVPAMSKEESDLASLEREIEALLSGKPAEPARAAEPAVPDRAVAREALEEPSVDPLVAEVEAALADDADSLLKRSGGDIDRALATVFDARALGGQEEEVNRALIDAFGSSRVQRPSFASAPVTNPVPKFDGVSREMPAANPNASTASQAKPRINLEYAGEKPFEPAFPKIDPIASSEARAPAAPVAAVEAAASAARGANETPTAAKADTHVAEPAEDGSGSVRAEAIAAPPADTEQVAQGPGFFARLVAFVGRALGFLATLPLRACSFPMRFVPDNARTVVGIAAITMVLWTPAAWWFASKRAGSPGVGRVELVTREAPASAEGSGASHDAGHGGAAEADKAKDGGAADHGAKPAAAGH